MGISLITKGMICAGKGDIIYVTYDVNRLYYPLTININKQKPTITIRPIKKQIHLDLKCPEE